MKINKTLFRRVAKSEEDLGFKYQEYGELPDSYSVVSIGLI